MKDYERREVDMLPEKYRPLSAWAFWGYSILFSLGLIGFICAIVFACSDKNIARRNYARSFFIGWLFGIIIVVIMLVVFFLVIVPMLPPDI